MEYDDLIKEFLPPLKSNILFYLQRAFYNNLDVSSEDIIDYFNKTKTYTTKVLDNLNEKGLIHKITIQNGEKEPKIKVQITDTGLNLATDLSFRGLTMLEQKKLKAVRKKSDKKRSLHSYMQDIMQF